MPLRVARAEAWRPMAQGFFAMLSGSAGRTVKATLVRRSRACAISELNCRHTLCVQHGYFAVLVHIDKEDKCGRDSLPYSPKRDTLQLSTVQVLYILLVNNVTGVI